MGTNYRTGKVVFDAVASTNAGEPSLVAIIKNAAKAGILVANTGVNSVDVRVQVKASAQRDGGINSLDDITDASGWYTYHVLDADGAPQPLIMSVAAGDTMAIDLSVFTFDAIQLLADSTVDDAHGEITASINWGTP